MTLDSRCPLGSIPIHSSLFTTGTIDTHLSASLAGRHARDTLIPDRSLNFSVMECGTGLPARDSASKSVITRPVLAGARSPAKDGLLVSPPIASLVITCSVRGKPSLQKSNYTRCTYSNTSHGLINFNASYAYAYALSHRVQTYYSSRQTRYQASSTCPASI